MASRMIYKLWDSDVGNDSFYNVGGLSFHFFRGPSRIFDVVKCCSFQRLWSYANKSNQILMKSPYIKLPIPYI